MTALAPAPRLLLAEDDADMLSLVQVVLEEEGYSVTPATSLPNSLRALQAQLFHFVLTDLFDSHGQAPLQSIQPLLDEAAPIPVGVMTGWRVPEQAVSQADLAFLLSKPFDLYDLVHHVEAELHPRVRNLRQQGLVQEFFLALSARDWTRLSRLCTAEVTVASPMAPFSTHIRLPGYLERLEQRFRLLPDYTIEEVQVFARREGVAARYVACWQGRDGLTHRAAGSMHFRFWGGRIAQIVGAI